MKILYRIFIMACAFGVMLSLDKIATNTTPPDRPVNLVVWSTNTVTTTNYVTVTNTVNPVHFFTNYEGRVWRYQGN